MNEKEILHEIKEDLLNVVALSDVKDAKVRRIIQKSAIFPVYVHSFVTTKRKNKWIILWEARSKKNIGDNSLITFVCYQDTLRGRYAFLPTWIKGSFILNVYPPHFFSRFAQRMGIKLTGVDLLRRFFERNASYTYQLKSEQLENDLFCDNIYGSCKEGVALGVKTADYDIYLFKTFITYDMCKGEQIEDFARNEKIRQEIHEQIIILQDF